MNRIIAIATTLLAAIVSGCASKPKGPDVTGGMELWLLRREGNSVAQYTLERDGTFMFAGGADARDERTSWTTTLSAEQVEPLVTAIEQTGWLEREPEGDRSDRSIVWEVHVSDSEHKRKFKAYGNRPEAQALYERLDAIARTRFDDYLETFPRPGPQKP